MSHNSESTILIALHKIGPYHHARLESLALTSNHKLIVLETRPNSLEYPWDPNTQTSLYTLVQLQGATSAETDPPPSRLRSQIYHCINLYKPSHVVIVGWSDRAYLQLMITSNNARIPCIIVSDSRKIDSTRKLFLEFLKRLLLRSVSSALVAGTDSRSYLRSLGFPPTAIFQPWDVVDNLFFKNYHSVSSNNSHAHYQPFICVGRFIPEKNHNYLIDAYRQYQLSGGYRELLLLGHGPLENDLKNKCKTLPKPSRVIFHSFVQLDELAAIYKKSFALILCSLKDTWGLVVNEAIASGIPVVVSNCCGCSIDLVEHNFSGFIIDPANIDDLAHVMHMIDAQSESQRTSMTNNARANLESYSPLSFADGLQNAIVYASRNPRYSGIGILVSRLICFFSRR